MSELSHEYPLLPALGCVVWRRREPIGNFVLPSSGQWLVLPVSHTFPYMDICRLWRHKARRRRPGKMFPTTSPVEMAEPWVRVVVLKYSLKGDNSTDCSAASWEIEWVRVSQILSVTVEQLSYIRISCQYVHEHLNKALQSEQNSCDLTIEL